MIYLDNAATTYPKPESVYDAMDRANRELCVNAGRGSYKKAREASKLISDTKAMLRGLVHADMNVAVVFTPSITIALNEIIGGIKWQTNDVVYVSPYEHNAVARTLHLMTKNHGIVIKKIPLVDGGLDVDIEKMAYEFSKEKPKAVICTHISNVTGYIYDEDYDSKSDSKIARYREEMKKYEDRLAVIEKRLEEIDNEELTAKEKQKEYEIKLVENKDSEKLANERTHLLDKIERLEESKIRNTHSILENFNKSGAFWMSSKLINDALEELANADKLDTGIPDIHARTIQYLLGRKKCICGADIEFGSSAYTELNRLLDYIPPKSIGTIIAQFTRECELKCKSTDGLFEQISSMYSALRDLENDHDQAIQDIEIIGHKLEGMLDVGELQKKYSFYTKQLSILRDERNRLLVEQGGLSTSRDRCDTEINKLVLKDDNNRRIAQCKAYAIYMYRCLSAVYKEKETETRERLEKVVNDIFKKIYNGGFSLKIDEKYNIQVVVDDFDGYVGDIETSTAQSISVIFAFIAGVIQLARENNNEENSMLMTEAYPLVMDAPLSAFDKTRIKTVCDALPKVAEQVIIFIKDTDGEIAETNMGAKVGKRYSFHKLNEFETELERR